MELDTFAAGSLCVDQIFGIYIYSVLHSPHWSKIHDVIVAIDTNRCNAKFCYINVDDLYLPAASHVVTKTAATW